MAPKPLPYFRMNADGYESDDVPAWISGDRQNQVEVFKGVVSR
jgi:hypothetical protein